MLCSEKGAAGLEGNTYLGYHWNTAKQISKFDHPYGEVHQSIDTYGYLTCIRHSSWTYCLVGDFLLFSPPFGRNMFWTFAKHRRIRSETCLLLWGMRESPLPKQTETTCKYRILINFQQDFMIQILLKFPTGEFAVSWENGGLQERDHLGSMAETRFSRKGWGESTTRKPYRLLKGSGFFVYVNQKSDLTQMLLLSGKIHTFTIEINHSCR